VAYTYILTLDDDKLQAEHLIKTLDDDVAGP
jgi:hypothetical protein